MYILYANSSGAGGEGCGRRLLGHDNTNDTNNTTTTTTNNNNNGNNNNNNATTTTNNNSNNSLRPVLEVAGLEPAAVRHLLGA